MTGAGLPDIVLPGTAAFESALLALPVWLRAALGGGLGAIIGSFLATLAQRWPAGEQALTGRSRCDGCGKTLAAAELVPILSYAVQRGRCRACGQPIARDHVWIELAAAASGALGFGLLDPVAAAAWVLFCWLLIPLFWLDARHLWLPDPLVAALALAGLLLGGALGLAGWPERLIGGAAGWLSLTLVALGFRWLRGVDGMGGGDPKLFGAIGLWLGALALPTTLVAACLIGLVDALWRLRRKQEADTLLLPLGSYLALAAAAHALLLLALAHRLLPSGGASV